MLLPSSLILGAALIISVTSSSGTDPQKRSKWASFASPQCSLDEAIQVLLREGANRSRFSFFFVAIRRIDTILGDNVTLECDLDAGRKDGGMR